MEQEPEGDDINVYIEMEGEGEVGEREEDIDVYGGTEDGGADEIIDTRFLPPEASTSKPSRPTTKRTKSSRSVSKTSEPPPKKKAAKAKRAVVYSDDEEEEFQHHETDIAVDDDEDFEVDTSSKKKNVTLVAKGRTKGIIATKTGKGRGAKEKAVDKEITFRDERKLPPSSSTAADASISKRVRPEDALDSNTPSNEREPEPTPPPPKKRKLPTIKKNKPSTAAGAGGSSASTPSAKPSLPNKDSTTAVPIPLVRKTTQAAATSDFDLRNKDVYAQLFTKPAGSTPNSGLNRKEKEEERRRELNKMREEARAKRAEEAKHSFDLQANYNKISRFEEKLHARKSLAVFPNILGGAFKDAYDRKRRGVDRRLP
ncbi:hypothetical protein K474DRAFT_1654983 [Panus rudis PR-1116 ss-1]|nr:hypothetical protein K474DRAFT_1654983 [Panus rudis PR-1116 ss-1]